MNNPLILIVGPTASGKSDLAVFLAKKINGECVNADATQIYKGLDIATNKITITEQQGVKHHLLSFVDLNDSYSVSEYQNQGRKIISEIWAKGKIPIIVGGSGLYINALLKKYKFYPTNNLNSQITKLSQLSNTELWNMLVKLDPVTSEKIHINNRRRLLRAITLITDSGIKKSDNDISTLSWFYHQPYIIGLLPQRNLLHEEIAKRVLKLIDKGLFSEVYQAYKYCNYDLEKQSMKIIGCREIVAYMQNEISYQQTIELMIIANRRYARKQLTWFNHQLSPINWYKHQYCDFSNICQNIFIDLNSQKNFKINY